MLDLLRPTRDDALKVSFIQILPWGSGSGFGGPLGVNVLREARVSMGSPRGSSGSGRLAAKMTQAGSDAFRPSYQSGRRPVPGLVFLQNTQFDRQTPDRGNRV
jgi:hypothetical protein